jgi:YidC/Oxa1 family membrane protein insertase
VESYNGLSQHVRAGYHVLHATSVSQLPSGYVSKTSCQSVAPGSAKFLFLPDITNKATGVALVVLLVLYVGSQVASTALMSASADPSQRRLMMIFPLFFVLILYGYPAGLLVYWITTNLWTMGQGWFVRRKVGPPPAPPGLGKGLSAAAPVSAAAGARGSDGGGPSNEPALAGGGATRAAPPPSARKKKKRSGRRR